jgi:ribonuclease BN (tRNA processing enzyme)
MKITILGCGNAFSNYNYNQCFLLEEQGRRMLLDYGYQAPAAIVNAGIDLKTIDDVYISHLHADHIGGLEQMSFLRYDWVNRPRRWDESVDENGKSYAPRLIANVRMMDDLWKNSLRGGLESMEGFDATLATYFEPTPIEPNQQWQWQGWDCDLVQQVHVMTGSVIMNTFGLMMKKKGHKTIYFTTDSQHCSPKQVEVFYRQADIIFQDCELAPIQFASGVHANYAQLAGYPEANSVKLDTLTKNKMWLSHYQDYYNKGLDFFGNQCDWDDKAGEDGFCGFLKVGQTFEI